MLGSLVAAFVSGEALDAVRRTRRAAIMYFLAFMAGLVGLGFLVGAAYIAAARRFGTIEASVGFGVAFLAIAVLIVAVHLLLDRGRARNAAVRRSGDMASISAAAAVMLLPSLLRGKSGIAAFIWPVLAILAHAIYRENVKPDDGEKPSE